MMILHILNRNIWRRPATIATVLWLSLILPTVAWAHPLGNFTINHYAGLNVSREAITIDYVLDMAEIPAFQEITLLDMNKNGQPDASEAASYHPAKCESIRSGLNLRVNDHRETLSLVSSSVDFPPGASSLPTLRLTCTFSAPIASKATQIEFADNNYADRLGWREVVVTGDQVALNGDFTSTSVSQRLTVYPSDMLSNPLDQRHISFDVDLTVDSGSSQMAAQKIAPLTANRSDAFSQLITLENLTMPTILFALVVAFVWGAMHALTPGHGKAVVGSYLIGERGTARHAMLLGLTTTITHTTGVFGMGLVTLLATQYIAPEQLFPWLSFLSGALVAGIGIRLMITRIRDARHPPRFEMARQHKHDFIHKHDHDPHDHSQDHSHDGHTHSHMPPGAEGEAVTWRSILTLGISGGILPCPSALIVLLSAISLGRIGFGLALVLAFSTGLASVLTAIGLLFVYAGRLIEFAPKQRWAFRALPVASALVISLAGLGITAQALAQIGWIRL